MHEGRDRVSWLHAHATVQVEAFLARCPNDPRLLPLDTWSSIDADSVFYTSIISDQYTLRRLHDHVIDELEGCHVVLSEDIYTPGEYWLEVSAASATKAVAINTLREELNADQLVCSATTITTCPCSPSPTTRSRSATLNPKYSRPRTRSSATTRPTRSRSGLRITPNAGLPYAQPLHHGPASRSGSRLQRARPSTATALMVGSRGCGSG